jgi:ankyrin repeat domain-containing protein 50
MTISLLTYGEISSQYLILRLPQVKIEAAINNVTLDMFLPSLLAVDQEKHKDNTLDFSCNEPRFWWIYRNLDFKLWISPSSSPVLWLCGQPDRNLHQVSSHMVDWAKTRHLVLYFFCSTPIKGESITVVFIHTILCQIISASPVKKRISIVKRFLHSLHNGAFIKEGSSNWKQPHFGETDSPGQVIKKILQAPAKEYWAALRAVLADEEHQKLFVVIDGLDIVEDQEVEFIQEIRAFIDHLQRRPSKFKALLTSRPQAEIKELFDGLPCIEHDKERKGQSAHGILLYLPLTAVNEECLASLRFDNSRYAKISGEHQGSFEWIWKHCQYQEWSKSDTSRLLYLQGKPGSGKSTLTKYVNDNLIKREPDARSAIVAKFFYSYREGEVHKSHYSMLRSVLYDILDRHEAFFYHCFQSVYRKQAVMQDHGRSGYKEWDYRSLQKVLLSLRKHSLAERFYLIIDAVDESEENDRREILELLFRLCSETEHCKVKVFVASRPIPVLERRISDFHSFIRLQDETKADLSRFAESFLKRLEFASFRPRAREYIVKNARGVFLWVKLVGEELLACDEQGRANEDAFQLLKSFPTELEQFYEHMLGKMKKNMADIRDAVKIFRFVLFAHRPLTAIEILHALGVSDNPLEEFKPSDESFKQRIPHERRIISCGGNFIEIKKNHGTRTTSSPIQISRLTTSREDSPGYASNRS